MTTKLDQMILTTKEFEKEMNTRARADLLQVLQMKLSELSMIRQDFIDQPSGGPGQVTYYGRIITMRAKSNEIAKVIDLLQEFSV